MKRTLIAMALLTVGFISGLTIQKGRNYGECYEAWTSTGYHLFICDGDTRTPEDDYVYDWEDNRVFEVIVKD